MKQKTKNKTVPVLLKLPKSLHSETKIEAVKKGEKLYSYLQACIDVGNKEIKRK